MFPKNKHHKLDSELNIYYNVRIDKDNSVETNAQGIKVASFRENRVDTILNNPSEYEMAIERFKVPALDIPILIWKPNYYSVSMTFDGVTITEYLQFIPNYTGQDLYGDSIWNYQELIDSLNNALALAFTTLKAAKPAAPPTETPFVTYDAPSQLFTFWAEQLYDVAGPATIEVFFNDPLYQLFSFQAYNNIGAGQATFKILIKDNKNNSTVYNAKNYYTMVQPYTTLPLWNDLAQIVFETDTIPVRKELEPGQTNKLTALITDFEPISAVNDRTAFQYYPQGPLRFYDLQSTSPLKSIDVKVKWVDKQGKDYPLYLDGNDAVTVKILFRKKYLYD